MKPFPILLSFLLIIMCSCKRDSDLSTTSLSENNNIVRHAKGFSIVRHDGFTIVKVSNPWPNSSMEYTYILKQKSAVIPDSLAQYQIISVPIKKIIVTSTTHIPSLEMLEVESSLIGFPNMKYISSEKVRARIDAGRVHEVGSTQNLNTEIIINLQPHVIVAHGIDNNNPALDNLQKSGLNVMLNGDWNEPTALGKAEWIKFFGALYGLDTKADSIFSDIEKEYSNILKLASKVTNKPTVLSGAIYQDKWNLPQGDSWGALMLAQAGGSYLWADTKGTGSLSLPFETVFEKGKGADFWIGPGQFTSFNDMTDSNPHYKEFQAFKNRQVYSYSIKKGKTGGVLYYELAPNRPDLVMKDLVKILHPELLPEYDLYFFEKLK